MHGIFETFGGAGQTLGCGISGGLQLGAQWLNDKVNGILVVQNL